MLKNKAYGECALPGPVGKTSGAIFFMYFAYNSTTFKRRFIKMIVRKNTNLHWAVMMARVRTLNIALARGVGEESLRIKMESERRRLQEELQKEEPNIA